MPRLVRELLGDMLDEARFLVKEVAKRAREDFLNDGLIHDYSGVDYIIVWDVALNEAPSLVEKIERILEQLSS